MYPCIIVMYIVRITAEVVPGAIYVFIMEAFCFYIDVFQFLGMYKWHHMHAACSKKLI